mmetsp:Transcript_28970/g.51794  ORF Transcript_28970/g.51794 Transcript_28970/m.51794 type:complete len:516 (-) Transcript_28970:47-1594(-)
MKGYGGSLIAYHVITHSFSLIVALLTTVFSSQEWTNNEGCEVGEANLGGFILAGCSTPFVLASAVMGFFILYRMYKAKQFTNFVVAHVIWLQTQLISNVIIAFVLAFTENCAVLYLNKLCWVSLGFTIFIARCVDNDFREALGILFKVKPLKSECKVLDLLVERHMNSVDYEGVVYFQVFKSLQTKFILDSLISLSLKFLQAPHLRINPTESFFQIDSDDLRGVLSRSCLNDFFDIWTADKYNVVEYFPTEFLKLRTKLGHSNFTVFNSLNALENLSNLEKLSQSRGGSSGAFMYTSHDSKFVLKTITTQEKLVLLNKLLTLYLSRLQTQDSALVRVLGVFQVQCVNNYSTNLVLMENIFADAKVLRKFDLKGSLYNRETKSATSIGKDVDFLKSVGSLSLIEEDAETLLRRVERDSEMLLSEGLMDYSLLVGVCEDRSRFPSNYSYRSTKEGEVYLIALIDFLQEYNTSKRLENFFKVKVRRAKHEEVSSVEPVLYRERFINFVKLISSYQDRS